MRSCLAAFLSELYRTRCRRTALLVLSLPAVTSVLRIFFGVASERMQRARQLAEGVEWSSVPENGFGPLGDGVLAGSMMLTFVALALGASVWVRDRESGVLSYSLLGQTRVACLAGKILAVLAQVFLMNVVLVLASLAAAALLYDLGPVVEEGFEMATAGELWSDFCAGCVASVPAFLGVALLGVVMSVVAHSTAAAVAGGLGLAILFDFLHGTLGEKARYVVLTYAPSIGRGAPLDRLPNILRAFSDAAWESGELREAVTIAAVEGAALVLLAGLIVVLRRRP
jgi:hypothetical protein